MDDATGKLVELLNCDAAPEFDYMHSAKRHFAQYLKPVTFYIET